MLKWYYIYINVGLIHVVDTILYSIVFKNIRKNFFSKQKYIADFILNVGIRIEFF